jgi:hypothetical protein
MELLNQVRGYHFLLGVLKNRKEDPFCSVCSAFANTLTAARESFSNFETEHAEALKALAPEFSRMLADTRGGLTSLQVAGNPSGQKKVGNCKLPQGVCFIKTSFALIQKI